jgi:cell division protease FtsH
LQDSHQRAQDIIAAHRDKLDTIAKLLLERETLEGRDVEDIVQYGCIRTEEERRATDDEAESASPDAPAPPVDATDADDRDAALAGTHARDEASPPA